MKLQLALDCLTTAEALRIADQAVDFVDFIEAGTPLIKSEGLQSVRVLKERYLDKWIVADMKIMDTGFLEAEMAYKAGADVVTVLGLAPKETIQSAIHAAQRYRRRVMVDSLGITDFDNLFKKIENTSVDYLLVHTGIDQQHAGHSPFCNLKQIHEHNRTVKLALVGGLNERTLTRMADFSRVELVIVGAAITKAANPREAARLLRRVLDGNCPKARA